ncbi:copper chaperone PCu(A)C [Rickettsia oklahomensis]|uniref:Copper chaperone PCu(A)C n=1 Tax=Rickettsia oklahomensis TaxID=3141789 RepID=A0AAU7BZY1_9RICK
MLKTLLISFITLICLVSYADNQTVQNPNSTNSSYESINLLPAAVAVNFIQPWARPTAANVQGKVSNSAMYFTLVNSRSSSYNLVNISADIANKIELHQTITDESGVSKMVKVDYPFLISGDINVDFKPGGMHIMLYDLKGPLNVGSSFKITFFFDDNTRKTVDVKVANDNPYNTVRN